MNPSIYINLEDDVAEVVARLKRTKAQKVVLVCPKRCFLFSDSINLRLLKKQVDLLKKEVAVLTMDERGQLYAKEAGFELRFLSKQEGSQRTADISPTRGPKDHGHPTETERRSPESPGKVALAAPTVKSSRALPRPPAAERTDAVFPSEELKAMHQSHSNRSQSRFMVLGFVSVCLLTALLLVFVVLPKATVVAYPKSEAITRDVEVSLSPNFKSPDVQGLLLPATKFSETIEVKQKFESQGKREVGNKASGTVRIYNFTRSPLNLKADTTTLTAGTKTYALTKDIALYPPTGYRNSRTKEVDERTLGAPVEVVAISGGESSNLPAGTRLEITNKVYGSNPQFLFAKNDEPIAGGTSRFLSLVTAQDLARAQGALTEAAVAQLRDRLKARGLVTAEKSYTAEVEGFLTDKPEGSETPNFEATLKVRLSGLAYSESQLEQLLIDRVTQTLPVNRRLVANPEKAASVKLKSIDVGKDLLVILVRFEGRAVSEVNLSGIEVQLKGKSREAALELIRSKADVEQIDVTLAPSWQRTFPLISGKIDVTTALP